MFFIHSPSLPPYSLVVIIWNLLVTRTVRWGLSRWFKCWVYVWWWWNTLDPLSSAQLKSPIHLWCAFVRSFVPDLRKQWDSISKVKDNQVYFSIFIVISQAWALSPLPLSLFGLKLKIEVTKKSTEYFLLSFISFDSTMVVVEMLMMNFASWNHVSAGIASSGRSSVMACIFKGEEEVFFFFFWRGKC